jgi:hypothetical protein
MPIKYLTIQQHIELMFGDIGDQPEEVLDNTPEEINQEDSNQVEEELTQEEQEAFDQWEEEYYNAVDYDEVG